MEKRWKAQSALPHNKGKFKHLDSESILPPSGEREDHHLIFIIHGIGQDEDRFFNFINNMNTTTKNLLPYYHKQLYRKTIYSEKVNIHYIPVEWHKQLHSLASTDEIMKMITLPTVPLMRHLNTDCFGDIIYYLSQHHGQMIINMVIKIMNERYLQFLKDHSLTDFRGTINIVGHSLGGVIGYDILFHLKDLSGLKRNKVRAKKRIPKWNFPKLLL